MKRRSRIRVKFYDEAHLIDRGGFRITWWGVALTAILFMGVFILIGMAIIWYSPIKRNLPGYMAPAQRAKTEVATLKVDSIQALYNVHQAYFENLMKVLNTDRHPDKIDTTGTAYAFTPDSLMGTTPIEQEFIKKMKQRGYKTELPSVKKEGESAKAPSPQPETAKPQSVTKPQPAENAKPAEPEEAPVPDEEP